MKTCKNKKKSDKQILILNIGGTFNKIYDEINGNLIVPKSNDVIDYILQIAKISNIKVAGLIYKDSLAINKNDRQKLVDYIKISKYKKIIIVHGTDTMNKTALFLSKQITNKHIVITGAMKPFSINPIEATANLLSAVGFIKANKKNNIYISMHGLIKEHTKIIKNRELGVFECL